MKQNHKSKSISMDFFGIYLSKFHVKGNSLLKTFFFFLLFANTAWAQVSPLYLTWNNAVGCQVSNNPDRKSYFELIQAGECLRVCRNSVVTYTVEESNSTWLSTVWNVTGGQILSSSTTTCVVKWGVGTLDVGSVGATVTTTDGDLILPDLCIEILKAPRARFAKGPF